MTLAASYRAMTIAYTHRETVFAGLMDDRQVWERATEGKRRLAIAADAELRRRHPRQKLAPLRSAEPAAVGDAQRGELTLAPEDTIPDVSPWIKELAAERAHFARRLSEERARLKDDLGFSDALQGSLSRPELSRPLLEAPKPQILPSTRVLERVGQRQADLEARS